MRWLRRWQAAASGRGKRSVERCIKYTFEAPCLPLSRQSSRYCKAWSSCAAMVHKSLRDCRTLAISATINAALGVKPGVSSLVITPLPFAARAGQRCLICAGFARYWLPNAPAKPAFPPAMDLPAGRGAVLSCPNWRVARIQRNGHARGSCSRAEPLCGFADKCNLAPPKVSRKVTVSSGAKVVHMKRATCAVGCGMGLLRSDKGMLHDGEGGSGCPLPTGFEAAGGGQISCDHP